MSIQFLVIVIALMLGLAIGVMVGWLASRPGHAALRTELEKDRAVHAEHNPILQLSLAGG